MKIEPDFKPTQKDEIGRNRPAIARCTAKRRRSREPGRVHLPPRIMA
jgi:hypothetical protein